MAQKVGEIYYEIAARMDAFEAALKKSQAEAKALEKNLMTMAERTSKAMQASEGAMNKFSGAISALKGSAAVAGAMMVAGKIYDIGKAALTSAGQMEKNAVAFETMLGSKSKANKLMDDIKKFSAETPFEIPGVVDATKKLLAFGISEDEVIEKMKHLGDASMGDQEAFERLADAYGKTAAKGKVSMEEMNRFLEAGVPILDELAKQYNTSGGAITKMVEEGKIGFKDLDKALTGLTTGQGKFAGLMEKQSQTLAGQWSNLMDNMGQMAGQMGDKMSLGAKEGVTALNLILGEGTLVRDMFVGLGTKAGEAFEWIAEKAMDLNVMLAELYAAYAKMDYEIYNNELNKKELDEANAYLERALNDRTEFRRKTGREYLAEEITTHDSYTQVWKETTDEERRELMKSKDTGDRKLDDRKKTAAAAGDVDKKALEDMKKAHEKWDAFLKTKGGTDQFAGAAVQRDKDIEEVKKYYTKNGQITEQGEKIITQIKQKAAMAQAKVVMDGISSMAGIVGNMVNQFSQILQSQNQIQMQQFETQKKQYSALLDYNYQQQLSAAGMGEESDRSKNQKSLAALRDAYSKETNEKKKAALAEKIREKEKVEAKYAIEENYQNQKMALDTMMEYRRVQMARNAARQQREMSIFTATIQAIQASVATFSGVVSTIPGIPGFIIGGIMAAVALAFGLAQVAMIASTPLPSYAQGGVADSPSIFGEAGAEMAVPLTGTAGKTAIALLADGIINSIAEKNAKDTQARGTVVAPAPEIAGGPMLGDVYLDGSKVGTWISRQTTNGSLLINKRAVV